MNRPTHPVARLTTAIVASLAALVPMLAAAAFAPAALAGTPANDEYVLEIPGVRVSPTVSAGQSATGTQAQSDNAPRQGVVGENDPPSTALDSLLSTLGSAPGALVAGLAALIAIALAPSLAPRRPRRSSASPGSTGTR
jgi:hypothetical protein